MPDSPHRSSIVYAGTVMLAIAASVLGCLSCTRYPKLEAREPGSAGESTDPMSAPIILLGRILSNQAVGRPYAPEWDPYIKILEYRVAVAVEHVLRGSVAEREIPIYYFGYVSSVGGPPHLGMRENGGHWHLGDSLIFFLRREQGALRAVCDFWYSCVAEVSTGGHLDLELDPNKSLGCSIAELLLSGGPNTTDLQMARAILRDRAHVFSQSCTAQRLKELENDRSPIVREAAVCVERASADRPCQMRLPDEVNGPR